MLSRQTHSCMLTQNGFLPSHQIASLRWGSGWAGASPPCHPEAWFLLSCCLPSARSCPGPLAWSILAHWQVSTLQPQEAQKERAGWSCVIPAACFLLAGLSHVATSSCKGAKPCLCCLMAVHPVTTQVVLVHLGCCNEIQENGL